MKKIIVFTKRKSGHIDSYNNFYLNLFQRMGFIPIEKKNLGLYVLNRSMFFPSVETSLKEFLLCSFLGIFSRRVISGIYIFRPGELGTLTIRKIPSIIIVFYFYLMRHISNARVISIVSKDKAGWRAAGFSEFFEDPQLWDLYVGKRDSNSLASDTILFAGHASLNKGFPGFLEMAKIAKRIECRIVGEIQYDVKHLDVSHASTSSCFSYVSEDDLINAIQSAKFIWCVYSEYYDQSSGIFGRAIQLGRIPIVRKGSYLEILAAAYGFSVIVISSETELVDLENTLLNINDEEYRRLSKENIDAVENISKLQCSSYIRLFKDI